MSEESDLEEQFGHADIDISTESSLVREEIHGQKCMDDENIPKNQNIGRESKLCAEPNFNFKIKSLAVIKWII